MFSVRNVVYILQTLSDLPFTVENIAQILKRILETQKKVRHMQYRNYMCRDEGWMNFRQKTDMSDSRPKVCGRVRTRRFT